MLQQTLFRPAIRMTRSLSALSALLFLTSVAQAQVSVLTQNASSARDGIYSNETTLTPAIVQSSSFGKRFTVSVDNQVRGQALILGGVTTPGLPVNIMIVFTSAESGTSGPSSLWAFDADTGARLWQHSFGSIAPSNSGAPVIDRAVGANGAVYVLTKSTSTLLHAIDPTTGSELPGSPMTVAAPGFSSDQQNQRSAMLVQNGIIYVSFAHRSDAGIYHGFVIGYQYNGSSFTQTGVFNSTPSGNGGGVWSGADGAIADASGNVYVATGNGSFDGDTGGTNYAMSVLKLAPSSLAVLDWFAPFDAVSQSNVDADLNGGGMVLMPGTTRLLQGPTKFGSLILLDAANLGHFSTGPIQRFDGYNSGVGRSPIAWNAGNGSLFAYVWPTSSTIKQFSYDSSTGMFNPAGVFKASSFSGGGALAISSGAGGSNPILWAVGGGQLHGLNPMDVSQPDYWNSSMRTGDSLGTTGTWQFPTIANGKVYVPTGSSSVVVYGVSSGGQSVAAPTFNPPAGTYSSAQSVVISTTTSGAAIRYTTDGTTPTSTTGTLYSGPVNVSTTATLKAIAYESGFTDSPVSSAAYTIQSASTPTATPTPRPSPTPTAAATATATGVPVVSAPTFNPPAGTYTSARSVAISTTTAGAAIRYTTDGSTPTASTGILYSGPVTVSVTTTVKAIAYESGFANSPVSSASYIIRRRPR